MTARIQSSFVTYEPQRLAALVHQTEQPLIVVRHHASQRLGLAHGQDPGELGPGTAVVAMLPGMFPEWLGCRDFRHRHRLRFAYVGGAMARGIASVPLCVELAKLGCLAFFGSAGLRPEVVDSAIVELQETLGDSGWGANLIHSPQEPELENEMVRLFLARRVTRVSASAFVALRPSVVHYAYKGLSRERGHVARLNHVFAKVSRPEVAGPFLRPAPTSMLRQLVERGCLTEDEARLGEALPVASAITAEANSGGHTDERSLPVLVPCLLELRDRVATEFPAAASVHVGAAGGIGDPRGLASALATGADYVLLGTVHQSAREAGTSARAKAMLARADMADVAMAPAGDMFESGVKVQVLKKGTLMAIRGHELYDLYRRYNSVTDIPAKELERLEKTIFGQSMASVWEETHAYHRATNPEAALRAMRDPKFKLALLCRWYLGKSSRWAVSGEPGRENDYQIWCGPAMGAFNRWAKNTPLEQPENRAIRAIAVALLRGTVRLQRQTLLRSWGLAV